MGKVQRAVQLSMSSKDNDWRKRTFLTKDKPLLYPLANNEVLIRLKCRPINPSDFLAIEGKYEHFVPTCDPATPGFEGMGYVHEIGSAVTNAKVGQRVIPLAAGQGTAGDGTWQEYIKVDQHLLVHVPDEVEDEVAAQFVINPWTVVGLLDVLDAPKGAYVIQTAAGSVLGRMLIPYAKHLGVRTINIVRGRHHIEDLKELGADEVINSEAEDIVARVKEITDGKLAHGAIDAVAGDMTKTLCECVKDGGSIHIYGLLSGSNSTLSNKDVLFRNLQVKGFHLMVWLMSKFSGEEERSQLIKNIMHLVATGILKPEVGKKFDLADFKEAIEESLKPGRKGKVILTG